MTGAANGGAAAGGVLRIDFDALQWNYRTLAKARLPRAVPPW